MAIGKQTRQNMDSQPTLGRRADAMYSLTCKRDKCLEALTSNEVNTPL